MKRVICIVLSIVLICIFLSGCAKPAQQAGPVLTVCGFSLGKADAFLFTVDGTSFLIDTGEKGDGKTILARLQELGFTSLDYLLITHFDKDHVGGAARVLNDFDVKHVLQSNSPKDGEQYEKYLKALQAKSIEPVTVTDVTVIELGGVTYTVYPPQQTAYDEDASNNSSLIVAVEYGQTRMLFTGDAEQARLTEFCALQTGTFSLVKMPHHGSYYDALPALLDAAQPEYAVVTDSAEEPWDDQTRTLLSRRNITTYLTRSAPVIITTDGETLDVRNAS